MSDDCIFCRIAAGEIDAEFVYEDEHVVAFPDMSPQAPTHVLIIPRRHIAKISELADEDRELAGRLILAGNRIAADMKLDAGYRFVLNCGEQGGQSVYHVHLHLLGGRALSWPPG